MKGGEEAYKNVYGTIYKMYNNEQWLLFIMRLNNKTYWKWINLSENLKEHKVKLSPFPRIQILKCAGRTQIFKCKNNQ